MSDATVARGVQNVLAAAIRTQDAPAQDSQVQDVRMQQARAVTTRPTGSTTASPSTASDTSRPGSTAKERDEARPDVPAHRPSGSVGSAFTSRRDE